MKSLINWSYIFWHSVMNLTVEKRNVRKAMIARILSVFQIEFSI